MKYEYGKEIIKLIEKAEQNNIEAIETLTDKIVENIENDKIIHTFGTGHSHLIGIELFGRAGGLGNINAMLDPDVLTSNGAQRSSELEKLPGLADVIYNSYKIEKGDIMIIVSNSGRNSVPIEMAKRCKKEGIYCVALTNLTQSKATTSRHPSGKKLYELADLILDNCLPSGDAMLNINGILTGPPSSIIGMFLLNTAVCNAIQKLTDKGVRPYVLQSQNVDGFDNDAIYKKYEGRVKHY
ncbi:MAG: SIS domain-containing protein [Erysipelotrichaceae bacterium]|jgi:uncharacterized phosphosugar-binding protein